MSRKAQIEALLAASPQDSFLRFALAKEYEKAGEDAGAKDAYESLLADDADYVGAYYHLGKCWERLGQPEQAVTTYDAGIAVAGRLGEQHAKRELMGARLEIADPD